MTCSPFNMSESDLIESARSRSLLKSSSSWIESTLSFCSICKLESIISVPAIGSYPPYTNNHFQGGFENNIANGRFMRDCYPVVNTEKGRDCLLYPTRSRFIDSKGYNEDLIMLSDSVGKELLYCYSFPSVDSYTSISTKPCYRFSTIDKIRKVILLTTFFTLFLIRVYPLTCFNLPWLNLPGYVCGGEYSEMKSILAPLLLKHKDAFNWRFEWVRQQLINCNLMDSWEVAFVKWCKGGSV